ncbi:hypothetical protein [Acinetobacter sp. WCHAc010052]|jgi:hypothetical protein|uniref:hypothetical protein n=1 Tax=Acinetobacter sp. WCHAc010052 TaxID=2004647 RepID=UPI000B3C1E4F|nr:hypothetical protein [Acinetobacter sp. WCHAc010052]AXY59008.1 hypothetical protein CDG61_02490 [Acinetobacter sp. WCHAc010052]
MKISFQKIAIVCLATSMVLSSGCVSPYFKRSYVSVAERDGGNGNTVGSLFVWDSDVSAAFVYPKGEACVQRALTTKDVKASVALSDQILKWTRALEISNNEKEREALSAAIATTSTLLTTTTERTAFLDTGLFYLCQLGANNTLKQDEVVGLSVQLIKSAAGLEVNKSSATVLNRANAPVQLIAPIPSTPLTEP